MCYIKNGSNKCFPVDNTGLTVQLTSTHHVAPDMSKAHRKPTLTNRPSCNSTVQHADGLKLLFSGLLKVVLHTLILCLSCFNLVLNNYPN